jgi:hypothetical protein
VLLEARPATILQSPEFSVGSDALEGRKKMRLRRMTIALLAMALVGMFAQPVQAAKPYAEVQWTWTYEQCSGPNYNAGGRFEYTGNLFDTRDARLTVGFYSTGTTGGGGALSHGFAKGTLEDGYVELYWIENLQWDTEYVFFVELYRNPHPRGHPQAPGKLVARDTFTVTTGNCNFPPVANGQEETVLTTWPTVFVLDASDYEQDADTLTYTIEEGSPGVTIVENLGGGEVGVTCWIAGSWAFTWYATDDYGMNSSEATFTVICEGPIID